jgi:hypothetical protein
VQGVQGVPGTSAAPDRRRRALMGVARR